MSRYRLKQQLMRKNLSDLNRVAGIVKEQIRQVKARGETWPVANLLRSMGDSFGELLVAPDAESQKEQVVDGIVDGAFYLLEHDPDDEELRRLLG